MITLRESIADEPRQLSETIDLIKRAAATVGEASPSELRSQIDAIRAFMAQQFIPSAHVELQATGSDLTQKLMALQERHLYADFGPAEQNALRAVLSELYELVVTQLLSRTPVRPNSYRIQEDESGISIELADVGGKEGQLLRAFSECQAGQCSCPTDEYGKVASMDVEQSDNTIKVRLEAQPGKRFDTAEIAACLEYTAKKVDE
jgi:hypothetical protein